MHVMFLTATNCSTNKNVSISQGISRCVVAQLRINDQISVEQNLCSQYLLFFLNLSAFKL